MIDEELLDQVRNNEHTEPQLYITLGIDDTERAFDIEKLIKVLRTNTYINHVLIDGSGAAATDEDMELLSHLTVNALSLFSLLALNERINILAKNTAITYLNISGSEISNRGFAQLVKNNKTIKTLSVNDNYIGIEGLEALQFNGVLEEINMASQTPQLDSGCVDYFMDKKSLTALNLSRNFIDDEGIKKLATHPSLKKLNLSKNLLSIASVSAFANNTVLESLDLSDSFLTAACFMSFNNSQVLQELILRHNSIKDDAGPALASIQSLKRLNICHNPITEKFLECFKGREVKIDIYGTMTKQQALLTAYSLKRKTPENDGKSESSSRVKFGKEGE